jgi:hypothetical protein
VVSPILFRLWSVFLYSIFIIVFIYVTSLHYVMTSFNTT